jgi:hypothetical protein
VTYFRLNSSFLVNTSRISFSYNLNNDSSLSLPVAASYGAVPTWVQVRWSQSAQKFFFFINWILIFDYRTMLAAFCRSKLFLQALWLGLSLSTTKSKILLTNLPFNLALPVLAILAILVSGLINLSIWLVLKRKYYLFGSSVYLSLEQLVRLKYASNSFLSMSLILYTC